MIKSRLLYILLPLLAISELAQAKVITFFVKRYPSLPEQEIEKKLAKTARKLGKPGKINKYILRSKMSAPSYIGIHATYAGYIDVSDNAGQLSFPKKHHAPFVDLLITNKIVPVTMMGRIIHHWEIAPRTPAQIYRIERQQDPETELNFLKVTKKEISKTGRIPLRSILLFAKPKNVFVPTGTTLTKEDPNLILPDVYIKKGFNSAANAFFVLTMRQYFETPQAIYKDTPYGYAQQLATIG